MAENILVMQSDKRQDTSIIQFQNKEWTWADFDVAASEAFRLAETGQVFIISDLLNNGAYLPKGRTAFGATSFVTKNMPDKIRYWVIVGPPIVQTTLEFVRKMFPKVRFAGAKTIEEAYAFIAAQPSSSQD